MKEYIDIFGKSYRVESNVMGVQLGMLEIYGGDMPKVLGVKDWITLLHLSIYWGEQMEGRESDFSIDKFCMMDGSEGSEVIRQFQEIFVRQHPAGEGETGKKKE